MTKKQRDNLILATARAVLEICTGTLCSRCGGWGTIDTANGPDECPECHGAQRELHALSRVLHDATQLAGRPDQ